MRPSILFPLFAETRTLAGVGPKLQKLIARVAGTKLVDLVFQLPTGVVDRSYRPKLADAETGRIATILLNVLDHLPSRVRGQPYRVRCSDETATIELVFFHGDADYLNRSLPPRSKRLVSGRVERYSCRLQMAHPDYMVAPEEAAQLPSYEPVYPLTDGLPAKSMAKAVRGALDKLPRVADWLDAALRKSRGWPDFFDALQAAHAPSNPGDLDANMPARQRLAYDEMLANQLALLMIRANMRTGKGRSLKGSGKLRAKALSALPFKLTEAQRGALAEIDADMASEARMLRLLQGDVGSGKTIVAFLALLTAIE